MRDELPQGWENTALAEIAGIIMGQSPSSATYNTDGQGLPFFQGKAEFGDLFPTVNKYCSAPVKVAEPKDILISVRAPVGPTNLCGVRSCIGRGLTAIRPKGDISHLYILYFLRSIEQWLSTQGSGSTFTAISKADVESIRMPLAPLVEQLRIVAQVERLLTKVNDCQRRLVRIPVFLKRFRQSVLAAACSGRLTSDWRSDQQADELKLTEPTNPSAIAPVEEFLDTPDDWRWLPLAALCDPTRAICYGVIKLGPDFTDGVPCLRTSDVKPLRIDTSKVKLITPSISRAYERTVLRGGEVLVNVRGTLGGVAVVPSELIKWNISREVALVPVGGVVPEFIAFWIASRQCQNWLTGVAKGVAYTGINIEDLRLLPVAVPSIVEQEEIVRRVKLLFSLAGTIEARYTKANQRADQLSQSILAKAFQGELVPTEAELAAAEGRDYETAEQLLEKIRSLQPGGGEGRNGKRHSKSRAANP